MHLPASNHGIRWLKKLLLLLFTGVTMAMAEDLSLPETLLTRDGIVYPAAIYARHDAATVYFLYADGAASVPLANLSDELRVKFHYDPESAEATLTAQAEARRTYNQSIAEIRARLRQETQRAAAQKSPNPEDVVSIVGTIVQTDGEVLIIFSTGESTSAPTVAAAEALKEGEVAVPVYPAVTGTLALADYPSADKLEKGTRLECHAIPDGTMGDVKKFAFVETPTLAIDPRQPRKFGPTLLDKLSRQTGH